MTRTLQERPGLPGSARNDPSPERVGFLSAHPGCRSTALLGNREHVIGACAKLADALLRGCAAAGHRAVAFARASRHSGQVARAVRGAPLLRLRWVGHPTADDAASRLRGREMSIMAAIRQTTAGRGGRSVSTSAKRVGPGPGDPGSTPGRRPAESCRPEQLPPATQVPVRGSQIEVDRVQP